MNAAIAAFNAYQSTVVDAAYGAEVKRNGETNKQKRFIVFNLD
jgi:hypothetical protein